MRVLYDGVGSMFTSRKLWRHLRQAGVEVRSFHPLRPLRIVTNFARDHRKLVVADGAAAVLGGLCIGCEWTGDAKGSSPGATPRCASAAPPPPCSTSPSRGPGPRGRTAPPDEEAAGRVTPEGDGEVRVIVGEPGRERAFRVIELLAAGSVERLWITDAYMVAPPRLFQALRDAARDGVDVRMLVPGSSDLPLIRNLSRIGYRDLLRSGVRIYEWDGPMLHAKTIVVDGRWVRIGSSNLNPSSLIGNYELDVLVEDPALAEAMERQFRLDIGRSREVRRRPMRGPRRISEALPTALTRAEPEVAASRHRRSRREARPPRGAGAPHHRQQRPPVGLHPAQRHLRGAGPALLRAAPADGLRLRGHLRLAGDQRGAGGVPEAGGPVRPPRDPPPDPGHLPPGLPSPGSGSSIRQGTASSQSHPSGSERMTLRRVAALLLLGLAVLPARLQGQERAVTLADAIRLSERVQPAVVRAAGDIETAAAQRRSAWGCLSPVAHRPARPPAPSSPRARPGSIRSPASC